MSISDKKKKRVASEYLGEYRQLKRNVFVIKKQIYDTAELIAMLESKCGNSPCVKLPSRAGKYLKIQNENLEELKLRLVIVSSRIKSIERTLELLDGNELEVIKEFYFSESPNGRAEILMNKLFLEKSQIYRIKDNAEMKVGEYLSLGMEEICE